MTLPGPELERIRKGFGMSRVEFARELGLTGNHSGAYKAMTFLEGGKRPISLPMAKLAWLLSTLPALPEWPDHLKVSNDV
jgi:hypothetical protein